MLTWSEIVQAICNHPRMYVSNGTFGEVSAWLDGFSAGLSESGNALVEEWDAFTEWMQSLLRYPRNWGWPRVFEERFPDDGMALEQLQSLYKQFLSERESTSGQ